MASVQRAVRAAEAAPSGIVLIGAVPTGAAADLGWIVPATSTSPSGAVAQDVRRFVGKPSFEVSADDSMRQPTSQP